SAASLRRVRNITKPRSRSLGWSSLPSVMPGLVPASTSSWRLQKAKPWMAGTSPAMTLLTHCFGAATSNLRLDIEPPHPLFQSSFHRRIKFQNFGIVTRYNVVTRRGELLQRLVALKRVADAVGNRKHAAFIDMRVKVRAVGGDNDIAASGLDAHALQAFGMASDSVHRDAGCDLVNAIVKLDAIGEYLAHHCQHVAFTERDAQHLVTHATTGGVGHFGILNVIARVRKQVVVAGVIPMHVGGDD